MASSEIENSPLQVLLANERWHAVPERAELVLRLYRSPLTWWSTDDREKPERELLDEYLASR